MNAVVAYQGEAGAFGEEACRRFLPDHQTLSCPTFEAVVEAVLNGSAEFGMLPLRNVCAGAVPGVAELLAARSVSVVRQADLPVRMHLLGKKGAQLSDMRTVASHPVALAQCSRALGELGVETEEASNTAAAAKQLASSERPGRAVLASERAAEVYGLEILKRNLQDRSDNATTFVIIVRGQPEEARGSIN